jgi:hypothetical protein
MAQTSTDVVAVGVDGRREDRPGVPKEQSPPHPMGNPHWTEPAHQTSGIVAVHGVMRPVTPVYGTAIPPSGVSGVVRRLAYRIPDYRASRWMLLILADRIDVLEHNAKPWGVLLGGLAAGAVALRAVQRLRRSRRRRFFD